METCSAVVTASGDRKAVFAELFDVNFDSVADECGHFFPSFGGDTKSGKIRSGEAPIRRPYRVRK